MKYSQICQPPKVMVRADTAAAMLEDRSAFDALVSAGWLLPVRHKAQMRLFLVDDIRAAVERARRQGWPDMHPHTKADPL